MDKVLLTIQETSAMMGIGRTKLYELLGRQELPVIRIGKVVRIPSAAVHEWVEAQIRIAHAERGQ